MNDYQWKLKVRPGSKSNPHWDQQPRVPAGHSDGGQWTSMGGRGAVPRTYFTKGPGKAIIDKEMPAKLRKLAVKALSSIKVQASQIQDLAGITTRPAPGFGEGDEWSAGNAIGVYDPATKTIHIRPDSLVNYDAVISHELGHHILQYSDWFEAREGKGFGPMDNAFARMKSAMRNRTMSNSEFKDKMISMGLRSYSLLDYGEWRADSWKVYQYGSESQQANLAEYFGVGSLDELFGR